MVFFDYPQNGQAVKKSLSTPLNMWKKCR